MPRTQSTRTLLGELLALPWWLSVVLAASIYAVLGLAIPLLFASSGVATDLGEAALDYGWLFALLFLIPAPFAAYQRHRRKKLLDTHADLGRIRDLHWREFEALVAEAFSRIGYRVTVGPGSSSAGEINLVATAANEKILVQCKHWRAAMVGVSAVGDLLDMIAAESATSGAVVTSGTFSDDAEAFAAGKSIQLIDGAQLEKLVRSVAKNRSATVPDAATGAAGN